MGAFTLATTGLAFACSTSDPQPNNGDRLIVDVPIPPPLPPQPESDAGEVDPYAKPDAAAAREICETCACPTDTFCVGAMTTSTFGGVCALDGSALGVGCNGVPAACKDTPTCPCILAAIGNIGCYPTCSPTSSDSGDSFFVYCPSP
ncbi:MAG: hypothetical protein ABIP39_12725 [Polyangiaceae bacterium]